ncbi:DNA-binding transcriptional regulator, MarR family [Geodermatophilus amargosae]|uniref:DNA-binding transcriptional regulator, MarR family n=1 Tax=Geodermatophilus amargosae TaxID=1296565 RepID=A0A1I6XZM3_9ACTN|nr:MarR family transcriptional regulator [Geodermatophilus amargosae]SFT43799.1 DNA-binding transcriptional regulator, MarR family [Geodermatophilus amargosae]
MSRAHEDLVAQTLAAGRELSTAVVMFHTAVGGLAELSVTETKALEVIHRAGPLTPADLAVHTGLAPASVTALLDRLERKQVARRVPHPTDGRRSLVEIDPGHLARQQEVFSDLVHRLEELGADFDEAELATVVRYLRAATAAQVEATRRLTGDRAGEPPARG